MTESQQFIAILQAKLSGCLDLTPCQSKQLWSHFELLRHWNARLNLTSVIEMERAAVRHYAESLYLASLLPATAIRIADIGSGAGFPGFPIAVALPQAEILLIESDHRKAAFLREASDLSPNIRVRCMRAQVFKERVNAVVGRAVRSLEIIDTAQRTADWFGLLVSRKDAEQVAATYGAQVKPLPWDESSAALIGLVPRET